MTVKTDNAPLVWVVDSAYTGERHARIGLANRLGHGYSVIPLPYDKADDYQQDLKQRYLAHGPGKPLVVISGTGEETTAEIADLRRLFNGHFYCVYLASILPEHNHPRLFDYDLIASPQLSGANIVTLLGVPHALTQESLDSAYQHHADFFAALPKPVMAVLVGGNTRYCQGFNAEYATQLASRIRSINQQLGGCVVITNSRRTPPEALTTLLQALEPVPHYFCDWQKAVPDFYHGLLAHADVFIVTGDSLSMCSEAAFTGKPLLVDLNDHATETYHREIVGRLVDEGVAKLLSDHFTAWRYVPPDPTGTVAEAIKQKLGI